MTKDQTGHRPEDKELDRLQKSMGRIAQEEALDHRASADLDQMQTAMGSAAQNEVTEHTRHVNERGDYTKDHE